MAGGRMGEHINNDLFIESNLARCRAARDAGVARAVDRADAVEPSWSAGAVGLFPAYARELTEFTSEDVRWLDDPDALLLNFTLPTPRSLILR